jgi:hypothetical protein
MALATLNQILKQLETLKIEELQQLNQTIKKYLADKEETVKQAKGTPLNGNLLHR